MRKMQVFCRIVGLFLLIMVTLFSPIFSDVMALTSEQLEFFSENNILFYEPSSEDCIPSASLGNSDGSDVTMFGDWISVASADAIRGVLPKIELKAENGMSVRDGITQINNSAELRDIVVVALGANGGVTMSDVDGIVSAVNKDGKQHEIILTTVYSSELADGALKGEKNMMSLTNEIIKEAEKKYDNVSYIDWEDEVRDKGAAQVFGAGQGNISNPVGTELFAKAVQSAVNKVTKKGQVYVASQSEVTGTGVERVKSAVKVYGQIAMEAQKTYGTPWEVLIAQMQVESMVGQSALALETNNWLGIRGTGDAGTYQTDGNGNFAKFSSVEVSISAWAGPYVMRNGYYDDAFKYLDVNNWNMHSYLTEVISHYAPSTDGNDEALYVANVESIIENMIKPAREELGWPSSEEFAKQNHIAIGGIYPIGSDVGDEKLFAGVSICGEYHNGDINATAIQLSWPERGHDPWNDVKPEYKTALAETGVNKLGDSCSMNGNSCDAFVTTVMRYSGADPDFPCCGVVNQIPYLVSHPEKYKEIPNIGSSENMQPGDIRISSGHIEMYIEVDGVGKIASASHCDRTSDHGISYYADASYRIFRKI